jgi:hypothetical protein
MCNWHDRIMLEWVLGKQVEKVRIGFIWLRIRTIDWLALVNTVMNLRVP